MSDSDLTNSDIFAAIKHIIDPITGEPLMLEQRISGLVIKDKMVQLSLNIEDAELAEQFKPVATTIEQIISNLPNVINATVLMTAERPAGNAKKQETINKDSVKGSGLDQVEKVIAIASGKGGVGKSTTAINLAFALSGIGLKVGLLDADIYGPSLPRMLGKVERPKTVDNKTMHPIEINGLKAMSIGFVIPEDEPVIWRGPMVMGALTQMLKDVVWGDLDVLVVDMPPGTGDAQLSLSQQVPLAGAVIVSTPQDIALLDARKGLNMFRKTDVPVLGIIENMASFICPNCQHETPIFGHGGARAEATKLGTPFLGEIPLELAIREAGDAGHAIVLEGKENPHAKRYFEIAEQLNIALFQETGERARPRIKTL